MKKLIALLMAGTFMASAPVYASDITSTQQTVGKAQSDDQIQSALEYLKSIHAKLASMGNHDGIDFYVAEIPGVSSPQPIGILPGGKKFFLGVLLDGNGYNYTIEDMLNQRKKLQEAQSQLSDLTSQVGKISNGIDNRSATDNPLPVAHSDVTNMKMPAPLATSDSAMVIPPNHATPPLPPAPADIKHAENIMVDGFIAKSVKSSEFLNDVNATAFFTVGNDKAPRLYLVSDPTCPFCHQAWSVLQPLVKSGKISVQVILTHTLPNSEVVVNNMLANPDVDTLWMQGVGSQDGVSVPTILTPGSQNYKTYDGYRVNNNDPFTQKYMTAFATNPQKTGVPIMAYVVNGKVYATEGLPQQKNMEIFLSGLTK